MESKYIQLTTHTQLTKRLMKQLFTINIDETYDTEIQAGQTLFVTDLIETLKQQFNLEYQGLEHYIGVENWLYEEIFSTHLSRVILSQAVRILHSPEPQDSEVKFCSLLLRNTKYFGCVCNALTPTLYNYIMSQYAFCNTVDNIMDKLVEQLDNQLPRYTIVILKNEVIQCSDKFLNDFIPYANAHMPDIFLSGNLDCIRCKPKLREFSEEILKRVEKHTNIPIYYIMSPKIHSIILETLEFQALKIAEEISKNPLTPQNHKIKMSLINGLKQDMIELSALRKFKMSHAHLKQFIEVLYENLDQTRNLLQVQESSKSYVKELIEEELLNQLTKQKQIPLYPLIFSHISVKSYLIDNLESLLLELQKQDSDLLGWR